MQKNILLPRFLPGPEMEDHHKEAIRSNLALLCRDVDYARLRPEMLKHRLFPERQLRLLEERAGAGHWLGTGGSQCRGRGRGREEAGCDSPGLTVSAGSAG